MMMIDLLVSGRIADNERAERVSRFMSNLSEKSKSKSNSTLVPGQKFQRIGKEAKSLDKKL